MKIAIIGFNAEGLASYKYFTNQGHEITICDQSESVTTPTDAKAQLGSGYLDNLDIFDLIVRTPGLPPQKILEKNPSAGSKITSGTNEFFKVCPTKNIIGVTGTKGKGTTSTLIAKILEADGKKVYLGGNIGVPALSFVNDIRPDDWVVLELSSFQLIDLRHSPHISVCLMIESEHLNWHTDMQDYTGAKQNIFAHQTLEDIAIYLAENDNSKALASVSRGQKIPYFAPPGAHVANGAIQIGDQIVCQTTELKLLGQHNWQNVCAASTAAWQITHNMEALRSVLTSFTGLPYRLEFVREVNGVKYYNDSFGTTPETAIVAIQAFDAPKIMIVGGSEKGADYQDLVTTIINSNVKHVVCIGITGQKIADILEARKNERCVTYTIWSSYDSITMAEIVETAKNEAEPGDIVLLSCASASFDMFKDYKDRGKQFNQAVQSLASIGQ